MPGEPFEEAVERDRRAGGCGCCPAGARRARASAPTCCSRPQASRSRTWSATARAVASQRLQNAGFEVNIETVQSDDVPNDHVATPGPAAGRRGRRGLDRDDHRLQRAGAGDGARRDRQEAGRGREADEGRRLQDRRAPGDVRHGGQGPRDQHLAGRELAAGEGPHGRAGGLSGPREGQRAERRRQDRRPRRAARSRAPACGPRSARRSPKTRIPAPCCARIRPRVRWTRAAS